MSSSIKDHINTYFAGVVRIKWDVEYPAQSLAYIYINFFNDLIALYISSFSSFPNLYIMGFASPDLGRFHAHKGGYQTLLELELVGVPATLGRMAGRPGFTPPTSHHMTVFSYHHYMKPRYFLPRGLQRCCKGEWAGREQHTGRANNVPWPPLFYLILTIFLRMGYYISHYNSNNINILKGSCSWQCHNWN